MQYSKEFYYLILYAILVIFLPAVIIIMSYFLGERHKELSTDEPYESGIIPTGDARVRFPEHFYMIAVFFVIFDLETVFLITWAISLRKAGWAGFAGALIFILLIVSVLIYEWRTGALNIALKGKDVLKAMKERKTSPPVRLS